MRLRGPFSALPNDLIYYEKCFGTIDIKKHNAKNNKTDLVTNNVFGFLRSRLSAERVSPST